MEAYALLVSATLHKVSRIQVLTGFICTCPNRDIHVHVHVHVRSYSGYEIWVEMFTQP